MEDVTGTEDMSGAKGTTGAKKGAEVTKSIIRACHCVLIRAL
jgi:hypothetical protein